MIQLVATGAAAFPLLVHFRGGDVPLNELISSVILTCSASAACWALWYYGQRYVGELALIVPSACLATDPLQSSPEKFTTEAGVSPLAARSESRAPEGRGLPQSQLQWVQISTLNFWGARQVCSEAQNFALHECIHEFRLAYLVSAHRPLLCVQGACVSVVRSNQSQLYVCALGGGSGWQPLTTPFSSTKLGMPLLQIKY
jgi:hypothetical protein